MDGCELVIVVHWAGGTGGGEQCPPSSEMQYTGACHWMNVSAHPVPPHPVVSAAVRSASSQLS